MISAVAPRRTTGAPRRARLNHMSVGDPDNQLAEIPPLEQSDEGFWRVGETIDDLQPFEAEGFARAIAGLD